MWWWVEMKRKWDSEKLNQHHGKSIGAGKSKKGGGRLDFKKESDKGKKS